MNPKTLSITVFLLYLSACSLGAIVGRHPRQAPADTSPTTELPSNSTGSHSPTAPSNQSSGEASSTSSPSEVTTDLGGHDGHGLIQGNDNETNCTDTRFIIAYFDWETVDTNMLVAVWILFMCMIKCAYHSKPILVKVFPESCMLICVGVILGIILYFGHAKNYIINTHTFFEIILPPIMFDAGYFMPTRSFFDNIGTILCHAILGTLINALMLGFTLHGINTAGGFGHEHNMPMLHLLTLASLLAAVDPVAVLVVFDAVQVNEVLYIIVFGEALLNDGVAVVIYRIFERFSKIGQACVIARDIVYGCISFLVIVVCSPSIGSIIGLIAGFLTRFTHHYRLAEPLIVIVMGYISYEMGELLHLSGILSATFCGITMRKFVEHNITKKSQTVVKYMLHSAAQVAEGIIFMYLGISAVYTEHDWNTAFVILTVVFCVIYRCVGVLLQNFVLNRLRHKKLNARDEFIMSYGGLRGAIAFALAFVLEPETFYARDLFVTTTVTVVYVTNLFFGTTVEPWVALMKIPRKDMTKPTMSSKIAERTFDHTMAGVEAVIGSTGYNHVRFRFSELLNRYLKPLIVGKNKELPGTHRGHEIRNIYTKLSEKDARELARTPSYATDISRMGSYVRRQASMSELPRIDSTLFNPVLWGLPSTVREDRYNAENIEKETNEDEPTVTVVNYDPAKYAKHYQGQYKRRNQIGSSASQTHLADADHNDLDASTNDVSVRYRKNMDTSGDSDNGANKSTSSEGNENDWQQGSAIQFVVKPKDGQPGAPVVFVEPDKEGYVNTAFSASSSDAEARAAAGQGNTNNSNPRTSDDTLFEEFSQERNVRSGSIVSLGSNNPHQRQNIGGRGSLDAGMTLGSSGKKDTRE